jgi:hypothetical protein
LKKKTKTHSTLELFARNGSTHQSLMPKFGEPVLHITKVQSQTFVNGGIVHTFGIQVLVFLELIHHQTSTPKFGEDSILHPFIKLL